MMSRTYFYVLSNGSKWQLSREHGEDATFLETKQAAVTAGRIAARAYGVSNGVNTGLRIQRADGTWEEERSYGDDPFPPKG